MSVLQPAAEPRGSAARPCMLGHCSRRHACRQARRGGQQALHLGPISVPMADTHWNAGSAAGCPSPSSVNSQLQ